MDCILDDVRVSMTSPGSEMKPMEKMRIRAAAESYLGVGGYHTLTNEPDVDDSSAHAQPPKSLHETSLTQRNAWNSNASSNSFNGNAVKAKGNLLKIGVV